MPQRTWLITGCSTGLGRAIAEEALQRGGNVVATARAVDTLTDLVASAPDRALALPLDVTLPDQVEAAMAAAIDRFGRIDVLVNNAGFGIMGTVEQVGDAEARRLFDTNFFGMLTVLRAALPHLRAQRSGHIVNVASIGGLRGQSGSGLYSSSKFAIIGMSEALGAEVSEFGIRVTVMIPGGIRTQFLGPALFVVPPGSDYADTEVGKRLLSVGQRRDRKPGDPNLMARALADVLDHPDPPTWLVLGSAALQAAQTKVAALGKTLHDWRSTSLSVDIEAPVG